MPLKKFAKLDEIPEAQRGDAIELKDGSFALVEDPDTSPLTAKFEEEARLRKAAESSAKKAADELKKLQTEKKATDSGITGEQLEKIRAEVRADVMSELAPQLDAGKSAIADNRSLKLDAKVKAIAAGKGLIGKHLEQWWKLHADEFDLTDDGRVIVKATPGSDPQKHTESLVKQHPYWVEGTKADGGNASGDGKGAPGTGAPSAADVLANPSAALAQARASGQKE